MHRTLAKWLIAGAVLALALPAVAAWSMGGREWVAEPAELHARADAGFRHGSHLAPDWQATPRKEQFGKHCQVCHDFRAGEPMGLTPVTVQCASCHFSGTAAGHDAARLEFVGGVRAAGHVSTYDHSLEGHRERACAECHTWTAGPRGDFVHPDVLFARPATLAVCADCHHHGADDPGAKAQQTVTKDGGGAAWRATWDKATGCGECHVAGAPNLLDRHRRAKERVFAHASHVPPDELGTDAKGNACRSCHGADANAVAGMGVQGRSCTTCHFGDQGGVTTRLAADREVQRMPTKFSHATKGHQEQCSRCHPLANDAADPVVGRMYSDCTKTCHSERRVPRHGSWSCNDCHAHAHPGTEDEAKALATTTVRRSAKPSTFAFASTAHPGITAGAAPLHPVAEGRACSDCHRREVEGLARAAEARPFAHEGHVSEIAPTSPTSACVACHAHVADTTSAAFVFAFHQTAAKEAGSCTATCHQSPKMDVVAAVEDVRVPVFSHAQHTSQSCASCHVGAGGVANLRASVLVEAGQAFACARCHGHKDPEKVKITGGYETTKQSNVCFDCHVEKPGADFGREVRREQRHLLVGDVRQFHAKGGDCRKCHAYDEPARVPASAPIRVTAHRNLHASHTILGEGASRTLQAVPASKDCLSCHAWQPRGP